MDTESKANEPPKIIKDVIQAEQEASKQLDVQLKVIDDNKTSEQDRAAKMKDLGDALMSNAIRQVDELNEMMQKNQNNRGINKLINEKKHIMAVDFRKMVQATKKGIIVNHQPKNQAFIEKLADQTLEDGELFNVFVVLDEYILGGKEITISKSQEQPTDFENRVAQLCVNDAYTGNKLINAVSEMARDLGYQPNEVRYRLGKLYQSMDVSQEENFDQMKQIVDEYFPEFPKKQKDFLYSLYNPKAYLNLLAIEKKNMLDNTKKIEALKKEISEAYHKKYDKNISENELNDNVERSIGIKLSEKMADSLVDVLTQLYRQLTIDRGHKQFQETENEDFMHGITTTRSTIMKALRRLLNHFEEMENENTEDPKYTKMYKMAEMDYVTREINYKGNIRPVTRTIALPFQEKVLLSSFIENQISEFGHWREKTGYLHDINLAVNHPAHEGSFFKGIGDFSEQITGVNLDSILSLPDGGLMVEAFHLYTKILQEDSAKRDHRMFASTFANEFNGNNTKIENEVIEYLRLKYGKDISNARLKSAINGAVGLAQGIYMTFYETQAFIDPLSGTGNGGWESFGTNDAASSLMLSGGLHVMLRWRDEQHLYQPLFLEWDGVEMTGKDFVKSLFGQGYNHRKSWENAKLRMDSFYDLKSGVEGSPKQNLVFDKLMNLCNTAGIYQRKGWRSLHQFEGHFTYDENQNLNLLESFKSMDVIGYDGYNWFLKAIDAPANGVDLSNKQYLEKISGDEATQREELFQYIHKKYFKPFSDQSYEDYIKGLRGEAELIVKEGKEVNGKRHGGVKDNHTLSFDNYEMAVQRKISDLFIERAVTREVAARFPTKFLRIDKDRLNSTGKSRWRQTYEEMFEKKRKDMIEEMKKDGKYKDLDENALTDIILMEKDNKYKDLNRDEFSIIMRDLEFAESLLRSDTSDKIHEVIHILPLDKEHPERSVGEHADLLYNLNEKTIKELLGKTTIGNERIEDVLSLYKIIQEKFIGDTKFLDGEGVTAIEKFPFSFGVENTDMKLCAYRATGPRMIARQIKDMASMEKVVNGFVGLPKLFIQIAKNGDYSELIKYLLECQDIFRDVHGKGGSYEFTYVVAGMLVNYMRKDQSADSYGGIGGVGSINSIAAEIAGNSNLVREWDVRDIQQFYLALQQVHLLQKNNIDSLKGPEFEKVWKLDSITGLPKETGQKKQKEAYEYNIARAMKRFGGDWKNVMSKVMTEIMLLAGGWLLWQYIKKAYEEMMGGKKG